MENLVSLSILSSVFKDRKVFITGHTGFKGAWLTTVLHLCGAKLKGYSLAPEYQNSLFDLLPSNAIDSTISDIREREKLKNEIALFQPDFIFHLAAQPLVRRSYKIPAETFDINVTGTANVLEGARDLGNKCTIVVITTDKVYENKEQDILYTETDSLGGYDPYSASKACTELVVSSFRTSFFNPKYYNEHKKAITSVRAGNVIGGGDWSEDRIIPDIVRSLQKDEPILVRNPDAVRPWQHVLEPIGAYLMLAAQLDKDPVRFSKPYNIGPLPDDHLTVKELVEKSIETWGSGSWQNPSLAKQPHEANLLKLSIESIKKDLGWKPVLNANTAIEWTINWYKQHKQDQLEFTFGQIKKYFGS